jgi:TfoX/Sxy family transcriptional regulator of competence genes
MPRLRPKVEIQCKHFFGGAAAYADGRIFMTLTTVGLALKLPEESRMALMDRGATPLRYFPKGPIKRDYVVVLEPVAYKIDDFLPFVRASIRFTQAFPATRRAKQARSRARRRPS